ncbi:hypothetical protein Cni_G06333 [Canna indica]|uniref:Uncharacterized protein n=1 Tax=Canna indica TaxID=4628 RepID=A0AAQ3K197_9LILI|nr:hypothetical protein Cni_G06333 [Canna indica]
MADIALLVVEDFERKRCAKMWEEGRGPGRRQESLAAAASSSSSASALGRKTGEKGEIGAAMEAQRALQPRSLLGVAAFDGFFSA